MIYIYGLYVNDETNIKYIGKTNNPHKRLKTHISESIRLNNTHKHYWINKELKNGNVIKYKILQECEDNDWERFEIYWIDYYSKINKLTNKSSGGEGSSNFANITYTEVKNIIKDYHFENGNDFKRKIKKLNLENVPKTPYDVFKNRGWISWDDFLSFERIKYLTYEESKIYIRNNFNIKTIRDWRNLINEKKLPDNIPKTPNKVYDEWINWYDFLKNENKTIKNDKNYLSYDDAKQFIKGNYNITKLNDWRILVKQNKISECIPNRPYRYYKKEWISWNDFFSIKLSKYYYKNFISYEEAKKIVNNMNIKTSIEFKKLIKTNNIYNLPTRPELHYKLTEDWVSWSTFLNTNNIVDKIKISNYLLYDDAKQIIKNLNIAGIKEWKELIKENKIPNFIPHYPQNYYQKRKSWISWTDFLNNNKISTQDRSKYYLSYDDAKKYIKKNLGYVKTTRDWDNYFKLNDISNIIPKRPDEYYKKTNNWTSWCDFLDSNIIASKFKKFLSYIDAKKIIINLNIKSSQEYKNKIKNNNSYNLPASPKCFYNKTNDWISWDDYLSLDDKYLSYDEAKEYITNNYNIISISEWKKLIRNKRIIKTIPSRADIYYSKHNRGWISWCDFLNNKKISNKFRKFLLYDDAKKIVKEINIKSAKDYYTKIKGYNTYNLPTEPYSYYKKTNEWINWKDFLSK